MNFYRFDIRAYAANTRHLSWDEDLAYRLLLDAYYWREAPLPMDRQEVYGLVRATSKTAQKAVDAVLVEFFTETPDGWRNARCYREIASYREEKASTWWSTLTRAQRCAMQGARRAAKISATPKWLSREQKRQIQSLYDESRQKTIETGIAHQVDHIVPLRSEAVCGLHVPWNLQVLTAEKNRLKGNEVLQ
jgi:uncharacterized protein YdaU (DUF1376 family)